ncbi:hypothetical protein KM043_013272 [Ampulex compressa]|nr:hypothetical protein KM043_013272 [Ampulex compressa]
MLRNSSISNIITSNTPDVVRLTPNVKLIGELISSFSGTNQSLKKWGKHFKLLVDAYEVGDGCTRILLCSKFEGKALEWLHSNTEYMAMGIDELLNNLECVFGQRRGLLESRREFESRT